MRALGDSGLRVQQFCACIEAELSRRAEGMPSPCQATDQPVHAVNASTAAASRTAMAIGTGPHDVRFFQLLHYYAATKGLAWIF